MNFPKFLRSLTLSNICEHPLLELCSFGFNSTITDICWNNFLKYHQLISLYYFYQKILEEKTAICKKCNFFGPACFFFTMLIFSFEIFWITSIQSKHVFIIYAWITHRWIVNCWIEPHAMTYCSPPKKISNIKRLILGLCWVQLSHFI